MLLARVKRIFAALLIEAKRLLGVDWFTQRSKLLNIVNVGVRGTTYKKSIYLVSVVLHKLI